MHPLEFLDSCVVNPALIVSVFIVASCGLAYELIKAALASYLLGDSILQFSSIIGLYLFAMGIGAHLTRYIKDEDALMRFIEIEILVGIIGGISALALFVLFGFSAAPFRIILYGLVLIVGTVVGMKSLWSCGYSTNTKPTLKKSSAACSRLIIWVPWPCLCCFP